MAVSHAILSVDFTRPADPEMLVRELLLTLTRGSRCLQSRVIVLEVTGGGGPADPFRLVELCSRLETLSQPVVAVARGRVHGICAELLFACDLAIAAQSATFALPGVLSGEVPTVAVSRGAGLIGRKNLNCLALTGCEIDAAAALEIGLVNVVVPDDQVGQRTAALIAKLNQRPPFGLAYVKRMGNRHAHADYASAGELGRAAGAQRGG